MRQFMRMLAIVAMMYIMAMFVGCARSFEQKILKIPLSQAGFVPTCSDQAEGTLRTFEAHVGRTLGITVTYDLADGSHAGGYSPSLRRIQVATKLDAMGRLEVIAHEAAHAIQPPGLSRSEADVWADTVAMKVCKRFGIDIEPQTSRYLAGQKQALHILHDYQAEIEWAVVVLTGVR